MRDLRPSPTERVMSRVSNLGGQGCWEWTGAKNKGHGLIWVHGKMQRVHRVVYEWLVGPIPEGLVIDHLCRTKACVRPSHLEPVTDKENLLRGEGAPARNARRTHCTHGHLLSEENIYHRPGEPSHWRRCRHCRGRSRRIKRQKAKALKMALLATPTPEEGA